jgi:hypothetical protein
MTGTDVPILLSSEGSATEVTVCQERLRRSSDVVGRVGLKPTTGRL